MKAVWAVASLVLILLAQALVVAPAHAAATVAVAAANASAPVTAAAATKAAASAKAVTAQVAAAPASSDPYLWLEDVTGKKPLDWVAGRNAESTKELATTPEFQSTNARILEVLNSNERIPYVAKIGERYYNFWRDKDHERGIWRCTTLDEYRKSTPTWETVVDLDSLAKAEGENWVWHGVQTLPGDNTRGLMSLSRGGADASVVREFDLVTRQFVKDGFILPEGKSSISWKNHDAVYVGTDFGPGTLTTSGYPRIAKEWKRGTALAAATTMYEGKAEDVSVDAFHDFTPGFERDGVVRSVTFYSSEMFLARDGKLIKIEKPDDANASFYHEWLLIQLRSDWNVGGKTYAAGALLATKFDDFLAGQRAFDMVFEPSERTSLDGYSATRDAIILDELDNVRSRLYVVRREGDRWAQAPIPGLPEFGNISANAVDDRESNDYFLTISDFLTPTSLYLGTAGGGPPEKLKQTPAFFDATGMAVSQHEAVSKDGTRIPYFQVSPKGFKEDGSTPTLLNGYGGFEISELPSYNGGRGRGWLDKGGVLVVANIRGGGEFGPKWHQAALKANRPRAYEDFIAVAEDLIHRKVTSTPHLGIIGGSNGGLLMGNMLTMRPDLFGAIVCQVPLLDMRRYSKLLAGASWMGEYGDPDDPKQWEFIKTFSPYQKVRKDVKYPRTLFTTSTRDDRVHPGHARKMVAKMMDQGHDVLYYENVEGGHGGAANNKQQAYMASLGYTFLWKMLGSTATSGMTRP